MATVAVCFPVAAACNGAPPHRRSPRCISLSRLSGSIEAAEQAQARAQDRLDRSERALAVLVRAESTTIEDSVIKTLKAAAQQLAADAREEVQQEQSAETIHVDAIGSVVEDAQRVNQQLD